MTYIKKRITDLFGMLIIQMRGCDDKTYKILMEIAYLLKKYDIPQSPPHHRRNRGSGSE